MAGPQLPELMTYRLPSKVDVYDEESNDSFWPLGDTRQPDIHTLKMSAIPAEPVICCATAWVSATDPLRALGFWVRMSANADLRCALHLPT
jgi:hypothetical protein